MSVKERDPLTGHQTTGHEWNGITELNIRVPLAVWFFLAITHLYAVIVWILLPSWPLVTTYYPGLLGVDQRVTVAAKLEEAAVARSVWTQPIADASFDQILADPALMRIVDETGPALFGDNCAACHGADAAGGPGYPNLRADVWLWGGDADTIHETLRVGINASHPDTRLAQMPAFGRDGILTRDQVRGVAAYAQSLSGTEVDPETLAAGGALFAENCASCHGEEGAGVTELGAPNLTDAFWIYGGDEASLFTTIDDGRQGQMPAWEDRLSDVERKILTLHVLGLGGNAQ